MTVATERADPLRQRNPGRADAPRLGDRSSPWDPLFPRHPAFVNHLTKVGLVPGRPGVYQVVHLTRLLHREPFQMVTAIQQPGHRLWRVRKPLSPQAPDE